MTSSTRTPLALLVCAALLLPAVASGCAASRAPLRARLAPMHFAKQTPPKRLTKNHFKGDKTAIISERHMREILDAPVFLEEKARIGIVRVESRYRVDDKLPTHAITDHLRAELQGTGLLDEVTEMTTDWPASSGIPGLRELAARYRCEYLVLYRHRFVDRSWANGWTAMAVFTAGLGALFAPVNTIETAGVLEVTLFEVKTGTLLFTSYERVHSLAEENVYQNDRKRRQLKAKLMGTAAKKLARRLVNHTRRLAAHRPDPEDSQQPPQKPAQANPRAGDVTQR